jgi:hypothetical protein
MAGNLYQILPGLFPYAVPAFFSLARRDRLGRCLREAQTNRSSGSGIRLIGGIDPEHGERTALDRATIIASRRNKVVSRRFCFSRIQTTSRSVEILPRTTFDAKGTERSASSRR